MTEQQATEIDLCAILNNVVYLDEGNLTGKNLRQIVSEIENKNPDIAGKIEFVQLKNAINSDKYASRGDIEVAHTSRLDSSSVTNLESARNVQINEAAATPKWTDDYIQGMTFKDPNGNYYVAYRGTGDGRWPDNAEGMVKSSLMQKAAKEYFDQVSEECGFTTARQNGGRIIVTGHSKGGNEAQYVYMAADNAELIDNCYSMDGQGFCEATIKEFEERWHCKRGSDAWNERLGSLYSINGENDYVHPLGEEIALQDNIYYTETRQITGYEENDLYVWHHISYMIGITEGEGILRWQKDGSGNIINGKRGPVGNFAYYLSGVLMALPESERLGAARALMEMIDVGFQVKDALEKGNLDFTIKNYGNPVTYMDFIRLVLYGDGVVFIAALSTFFDNATVGTIVGVLLSLALLFVFPEFSLAILTIKKNLITLILAIKLTSELIDKLTKLFDKAEQIVKDWYNKTFVYGKIDFASFGTVIGMDTAKLYQYAADLKSINRRLGIMDERMNRLYFKCGLKGIYYMISADYYTSKSRTLQKCIQYLNDTAAAFESLEKELRSIQ